MITFIIFHFIPQKKIPVQDIKQINISVRPTVITTAVFALFFLGVFKVINVAIPMIVAAILALIINPRILLKIDYALLLTFTCFFIFISDIQQIPMIVTLIHTMVNSETSTYFTSIISSQIISNVPATILVGKFTTFAKALFLGSNIGGFGSPIGSMANMLVLKTFTQNATVSRSEFFKKWLLMQYAGLIILTLIGWALILL